ncbi:MAG: ParB/RepB/Spo0J family partition protein, partial [Planctomycetota bacterium]|nr:ParB/RepB/Spo0J family partition protein [Planctomycetota bacterium]
LAGLDAVPAIISELDDRAAAEWALVENLQREDLNAMERAWAFRDLQRRFEMSPSEIAERVGLDRSTVANFIRLTELEEAIQEMLFESKLSPGHGKALLMVPPGATRTKLAKSASEGNWSVRKLEQRASEAASGPRSGSQATGSGANVASGREAALRDLERRLGEHLGTRIHIKTDRSGKKGQMRIEFFGLDHFEDLMARIGFANDPDSAT